MTGFVLVLTFVAMASGSIKQATIRCSTAPCVALVQSQCLDSPACARVRWWPTEEFAPLSSGAFINSPSEDWQKS